MAQMSHAEKTNEALSLARKALRISQTAKAQREKKFVVNSVAINSDRDGQLFTLNAMPQGVADTQRIGDRISCFRIGLDLWRVIPGSASGRFSARILILIDKQNTLTNGTDIFLGTGSGQAPLLQFVKDKRRQFVVLYDSGCNHMDQYNKGTVVKYQRGINLTTQFNVGSDVINTGALKLFVISNQAPGSNTRPLVIGTLRIDY
jgi:hypothetical protein